MDIQFTVGVLVYAGAERRYDGTAMLSALPWAPVVPTRRRVGELLAEWAAVARRA
jgi:hypothetical protein